MQKLKHRVYSVYSRKAAVLMGKMIQLHRKERNITAQDLADRAGISRTTLKKVEDGYMGCEIGIVFEVAAIVGLKLFDSDSASIDSLQERVEDKLSLLPKSVRMPKGPIDDEF